LTLTWPLSGKSNNVEIPEPTMAQVKNKGLGVSVVQIIRRRK
jgi:hypothetical protein